MSAPHAPRERGFNVIGYATANLGLGVAARNTISRLLSAGESVRIIDIDPGRRHIGKDTTYAEVEVPTRETAYSVNVFHLNPPEAIGYWRKWRRRLAVDESVNVCVPFWELPVLPPAWVPVLRSMDFVLAPTHFIEQACLAALPAERVVHYPQTIAVPEGITADRARWGIPAEAVSFLVTLDINSDMQRKNPWAAIEAFGTAFPDDEHVRLVVRVNGEPKTEVTVAQMEALSRRAAEDPRLIIVRGALSYPEVLSLYASCDVLVSLHRSEGLGLHLMEAMYLGVPVVTTGWSGNMDFTDEESACLVDFTFVPVEATQASYRAELIGEGQFWAEPNIATAVRHMRRLATDPAFRTQMAERGRGRILAHLESARAHNPLLAIADTDARALRSSREGRLRVRLLRQLMRQQPDWRKPPEAVKHAIVVVLRALHLYPPAPPGEDD